MGIFDLFSNDAADDAAAARVAALQAAKAGSFKLLDKGQTDALGYYDKALVPFQNIATAGAKGTAAYGDAVGLNGTEGLARARTTFTSLPGYREGIDMALDQNDRRAAARGMLGWGNTIADTTKLATNYASQKYGDYLSSLNPYFSQQTAGATGQAGVYGAEGDLVNNNAGRKAGIEYGVQTGIGEANAGAEMARYNTSANFWNTLLGGASLALKASGVGGFAPK